MDPDHLTNREYALGVARRLQTWWRVALSAPILYLGVCLLVRHYYFEERDIQGMLSLSEPRERTILTALILLGVIGQAALLWIRMIYEKRLREIGDDVEGFARIAFRRFFLLAMICDSMSLLGLIYYLLTANLWAMFGFGIASFLLFAQIYPQEKMAEHVRE